MSKFATFIEAYKFNRDRTLATLDSIAKEPDPRAVLAWRPGPGRAHIGWQLMHIGITEELFASERLAPHKQGAWQELWPRFRGGSTPDDDVPPPETIRRILDESRERLLATLSEYTDDRLGEIPPALAQRGWPMLVVLQVLSWHESHHQGQAHLTYNLYKASQT
jgi:uncharacterized damage-inducible protein DinB